MSVTASAHNFHQHAEKLKQCSRDSKDRGSIAKTTVVNCGDVITQSIKIANDLNCPDSTGFALSIRGDNIKVDGNGKTIYAPNAISGLYIEGDNVSVSNVKSTGVSQGYGVFAYNTAGLSLSYNDFSSNLIGVVVYTESDLLNQIKITKNKITNSALFGIRLGQDGAGSIVNPIISGNNLSNSGSYAMLIQATSDVLSDDEKNNLSDSTNGILLKGGTFKIKDLDLSDYSIRKIGVFVDSAVSLKVDGLDVGSRLLPTAAQENIGLDLYRVGTFDIRGLKSERNDVGLKFETELGVSPTGSVSDCTFKYDNFAPIMVSSYDSTQYGIIDIDSRSNRVRNLASVTTNVFTTPGTVWFQPAPNSGNDGGGCGRDRDYDDRD